MCTISRITIKDIAKELGVHHSTVSRALRNDERVKAETRKLIVDYAQAHGYQVNISALHLRGSFRNVIAIVVPNINHQFFSSIISHFTDIANQNGFVISIFQSNENLQREMDIIDTLIQNNVAGVIASISMETTNYEHFVKLGHFNIPLVLFDRVAEIPGVNRVEIDNSNIVSKAVGLFFQRGYRRIAHVSGTSTLNVFRKRQEGYSSTIAEKNLSYHRIYQINRGFTVEEGKIAAEQLFSSKEVPDSIICDSDLLLLGISSYLFKKGIRIPYDVGLISFGDNPSLEVFKPSISTIIQPSFDVAMEAYNLLKNKINNKEGKEENIMLAAKIIERESCNRNNNSSY